MKKWIILLLTLALFISWRVQLPTQITPQTQATYTEPVLQDKGLLAKLISIGAKQTDDLGLKYIDSFDLDNQRGYYIDGGIQILRGLEPEVEKRVLAHEYLHYLWYTLPKAEQTDISERTMMLYNNDLSMQARMKSYIKHSILRSDEIFVIYCTESTDGWLLTIVDDCNKYIYRNKLTLLR